MTKAKDRHGYVDWPRRDDVRATDPPPRPQRRRKNTRRWCRGKEGVEHVTEVRLSKDATYRAERGMPSTCYRAEWYDRRWWCSHEEVCIKCGKIIRWTLDDDCPNFTTEVTYRRRTP